MWAEPTSNGDAVTAGGYRHLFQIATAVTTESGVLVYSWALPLAREARVGVTGQWEA